MQKINVLIFPAGAESSLDVYEALRYNLNINVFGCSSKSDHASFIYPEGQYFEGDYNISNCNFIRDFNTLLDSLKIDAVIPMHDSVALFLAENRDNISAKILVSPAETARVCHEKRKMYELFSDCGFCPLVYNNADEISTFPVIVKANIGAGGKG